MDDSTSPEYNEEFSFSLNREELVGKVLKLSLADHDGGGAKKVSNFILSKQYRFVKILLR